MKIGLECYPCFLKQAVEASGIVTNDEKLRYEIVKEVLKSSVSLMEEKNPKFTPVHMGKIIHQLIRKKSGNKDPYKSLKHKYNRKALEVYDYMKDIVRNADDPIKAAVKLAIAGNIIDFGVADLSGEIEIKHIIADAVENGFGIDHYESFVSAMLRADSILYLADNAGEIVFDRILIEEIPHFRERVKFVVKKAPIINDATLEDARETGITDIVPVIDSGVVAPGTLLDEASDIFLGELKNADLVISKGQGNYEALSEAEYPIFYLLKAKCQVIARDLGVNVGDIVLKYNWYRGADRIRTGA